MVVTLHQGWLVPLKGWWLVLFPPLQIEKQPAEGRSRVLQSPNSDTTCPFKTVSRRGIRIFDFFAKKGNELLSNLLRPSCMSFFGSQTQKIYFYVTSVLRPTDVRIEPRTSTYFPTEPIWFWFGSTEPIWFLFGSTEPIWFRFGKWWILKSGCKSHQNLKS